jgi:hypothetical protein
MILIGVAHDRQIFKKITAWNMPVISGNERYWCRFENQDCLPSSAWSASSRQVTC